MGVCNATTPKYMDAPIRVMETAIDMLKYMKMNEKMTLRIGIATGKLLAGCMSSETPNFDIFGATVNLASRLQNLAAVSGILIDRKTMEQTNHVYQFGPAVAQEVKGIKEPVETFGFISKRHDVPSGHGTAAKPEGLQM
jgi:class 3 adenylate cyclase